MFKNLDPSALGVTGHQSEILELALTYGFRGIDLNMVEFAGRVKLHGMAYGRRLIDSARIRIGTYPLPIDWDVDDESFKRELEKLAESSRMAADLGCTRCVCTIAPAGDKRPYHENFEFHKRRFAEICRVMEPAGVRLGVGFRAVEGLRKGQAFQFIHDLDALLLLLNMVGAPNAGLLVDVWDLVLASGSVEAVRSLTAKQVVAVQLADLPAEVPAAEVPAAEVTEAQRLVPSVGGKVDCVSVLTALAEAGYDGPITIKADRSAFENTRRDRIVRQAGEALDKLWKAARLTPDGKLLPAAKQ
jgi:sugar phosphate isomerase/epimerase